MNEWMIEWMNEWVNEWMNEWRKEGMSERTNEWTNERMNECLFVCMHACIYLSKYLSIHPSIHPSIYLSISIYIYTCLSICLSIYLCTVSYMYLCVYLCWQAYHGSPSLENSSHRNPRYSKSVSSHRNLPENLRTLSVVPFISFTALPAHREEYMACFSSSQKWELIQELGPAVEQLHIADFETCQIGPVEPVGHVPEILLG